MIISVKVIRRTKRSVLSVLLAAILLICSNSKVFAVYPSSYSVDSSIDNVGQYNSLIIVNGNPAMSYYDASNGNLKFIRATNAEGTAWGTAQTIDSAGDVGQYNSMIIADGNPAISYFDNTNGDLKFVRATDANGTTWGTPISVDSTYNVGQHTSLFVINGNPAISYFDNTNGDLKFVRATDANGTTWGTPVSVDSSDNVGQYTSLFVVNGNPAVSYFDNTYGDLKFIRATDANGSSWGSPATIDNLGTIGQYSSLQVVNGNPAVSYYDDTNRDLIFVRATDANGTSWGSPITLDSLGIIGQYSSLLVVNGNPAVSYYDDTNRDLKFIRATDANGTAWGTPLKQDEAGNVGQYTSMIMVNGNPGISYYDETNGNLKITIVHSQNISVTENTAPITSGDTSDFGSTNLNSPITKTYTIENKGYSSLTISSLTLPTGFSSATSFPFTVNAGNSASIQVRMDATDAGTKSGSLSLVHSDTNQSPYTINLTGEVVTNNNGVTQSKTASGEIERLPSSGFTPGKVTYLPESVLPASNNNQNALTLSIPGLDVEGIIVGVPQSDESWDVSWLSHDQVGWLQGSAYPTSNGNTVLTAHVTDATGKPGIFSDIKSLKYGQEISIESSGTTYVYEVRKNIRIFPEDLNFVFNNDKYNWVTLITCEDFDEETGEYLYRRMVKAVMVDIR